MTITTERLEEIAKLAIRLHQIRSCAAVTSSGETVMHHTHVGEILSALRDVTAALMAAREAVPVPAVWVMSEDLSDKSIISTPAYPDRGDAEANFMGLPLAPLFTAPPAPAAPVFFIEVDGDDWVQAGRLPGSDFSNPPDGIVNLYAAPPAPAVPDECPAEIRDLMASHSDALFNDDDAQQIWNACRSAMLGNCAINESRAGAGLTAETGENCATVTPGGYKLVPVYPTDGMIAAAMDCDDVLFNDDDTFCIQFCNIYAAMLAAAPEVGD